MMRRPQIDDDDSGGLDSLLDTMTNVVGILVMVLIAAQLGVKDAVGRIAESDVVDPVAIEAAREKLQLTEDQRDMIQSQLDGVSPVDDSTIQVKLADLRRQLNKTRTKLNQENTVVNQFALKIEADKKKADTAKKKIKAIADAKAKREVLQKDLAVAIEEEAKLKAMLDDTPVQEAPPPKVVTLPDPRPAPEGARQVTFLCAHGRVYPIAADDRRTAIQKKAEFIVTSRRLNGGPAVGVNKEQFMKEFKKVNRRLFDEFFEIELYAAGIYPRLRFIPKENAGATEDEVLKPRSRFQRMLMVIDKSKYYARFIVLPDSYEVYLAARSVADRAGLLSGWDPQGTGWQYTTSLGGPTLFGPKPPPNPNAKPAPPTKPANVID
jgi:hypothetical protein